MSENSGLRSALDDIATSSGRLSSRVADYRADILPLLGEIEATIGGDATGAHRTMIEQLQAAASVCSQAEASLRAASDRALRAAVQSL